MADHKQENQSVSAKKNGTKGNNFDEKLFGKADNNSQRIQDTLWRMHTWWSFWMQAWKLLENLDVLIFQFMMGMVVAWLLNMHSSIYIQMFLQQGYHMDIKVAKKTIIEGLLFEDRREDSMVYVSG